MVKVEAIAMESTERFSRRHGYAGKALEPSIQSDAPEPLRAALLGAARDADLAPSTLRAIACRVLNRFPDDSNWSEFPNIWREVQDLVRGCQWFRVYDLIEAVYEELMERGSNSPERFSVQPGKLAAEFQRSINAAMEEEGIAWKLANGDVQARGTEAFEAEIHRAEEVLLEAGRATASDEIHEALKDLSRRPEPDLTGAVQHAMAALECVARDVCGDPRATLGDIMKRNPTLLPKPLDQAIEKLWGYSSEFGRHLREGRVPERPEAELVVMLASSVSTYLTSRASLPQ